MVTPNQERNETMQTIQTKHIGATNYRGARMKARSTGGGSLSMPYDSELSDDGNHAKVAKALMEKLGWKGKMVGGGTSKGLVWVFADDFPSIEN